jgi:hypothetical protein
MPLRPSIPHSRFPPIRRPSGNTCSWNSRADRATAAAMPFPAGGQIIRVAWERKKAEGIWGKDLRRWTKSGRWRRVWLTESAANERKRRRGERWQTAWLINLDHRSSPPVHPPLRRGGPSPRVLARPNPLRPRKVDIGPVQVQLFSVFFLFCFFLFSFLKFKQFKFQNLFRFWIETNIYFEQNLDKFEIWTNFEFVQNSKHEQISNLFKIRNMNKFRICSKFKTQTKFVFEQNLNLNKFQIWTNFDLNKIWDMNKIEICSHPKFVQIRNLFKLKNCSISKNVQK